MLKTNFEYHVQGLAKGTRAVELFLVKYEPFNLQKIAIIMVVHLMRNINEAPYRGSLWLFRAQCSLRTSVRTLCFVVASQRCSATQRPCYDDSEKRGDDEDNWYNIHLLLRVPMFHNVKVEKGVRGWAEGKRAKRDRWKRVAFKWRNAGGGGMRGG